MCQERWICSLKWRILTSGASLPLAKSAHVGMFIGVVSFRPWKRIWKTWALGKCQFFVWLVAHIRCWTAGHLAWHGLPHPPSCPLLDQEESINHLLCTCPFSREFWFLLLQRLGLQALAPQNDDDSFDDQWGRAESSVNTQTRGGFNSIHHNPRSLDNMETLQSVHLQWGIPEHSWRLTAR